MSFGHLTISFDQRVLRPRPWTVHHSAWAAKLLETAPEGPVLEVCTGVGHIGLLAVAGSGRDLVLVDLDEVACEHARSNANAAGLPAVDVRHGRMDEVVDAHERFAVIIADPPWVSSARTIDFPADPQFAIDGGPDGLDIIWMCLTLIGRHLMPEGSAVLQLGSVSQVAAVQGRVAEDTGLQLCVLEHRVHEGGGALVHLART